MEVAKGDHVLFLDSDDFLSNTALSKVYNKAKKHNADVVAYNFTTIYRNNFKQYPCRKDFKNITNNKNKLI